MAHRILTTSVVIVWQPELLKGGGFPLMVTWGSKDIIAVQAVPCPETIRRLGLSNDYSTMLWASVVLCARESLEDYLPETMADWIGSIYCCHCEGAWKFNLATLEGARPLNPVNPLTKLLAKRMQPDYNHGFIDIFATGITPIPIDCWSSVLSKL